MGTRSTALARTLAQVGPVYPLGAREGRSVGTRLAILGFPHGLSLKLTRRAGPRLELVWPAGVP
jgi:hypothetical protein